ncbi:hypothetical protein GWI33_001572 [Rhynchophorus ferrugineus]|uniref:CTNNB1 binding N-teminal domain-containing protein n=1 Tax=Rhynchophorus ferrugineus TaxID=354439 RepID=A0A834IL54_RHYFE|nr:hypothetical protein GWI33_001572 [Rhynchophorus ferrugineus]
MPHVSSSGGDDLGSTDEVKVFKDEGNDEDEKRSSENLTEEKSSLIDLTESEEKSGGNYNSSSKNAQRPEHSPVFATHVRRRVLRHGTVGTRGRAGYPDQNPTIIARIHDETTRAGSGVQRKWKWKKIKDFDLPLGRDQALHWRSYRGTRASSDERLRERQITVLCTSSHKEEKIKNRFSDSRRSKEENDRFNAKRDFNAPSVLYFCFWFALCAERCLPTRTQMGALLNARFADDFKARIGVNGHLHILATYQP